MKKTGLVLGKFMPPHAGHQYLIEFARFYVDELTVLVEKVPCEPIASEIRFEWMKKLFPTVNILHFQDQNPQSPDEHPDFWNIWKNSLTSFLPFTPDFVFTSEHYGAKLAEILNAKHVMVDQSRSKFPVSATAIRNDYLSHWDYIPQVVREHYLKRICLFGPESTGKTTLAQNLATHYNTIYVPEYARGYIELRNGAIEYSDMEKIARGQMASEITMKPKANKILFCDTDLLTNSIWSHHLFGKCSPWIEEEAKKQSYDLYLLLNVDVPWVKDVVRFSPENRNVFFNTCKTVLDKSKRNYVVIEGSWEQRLRMSIASVNQLFNK